MERGWQKLGRTLGGSFSARARGVVSPTLILLTPEGERFGTLERDRTGVALLRAGDLEARIERLADGRYAMTTDGEGTLSAGPAGSESHLNIGSGDRSYEARVRLLRGDAVARRPGGGEAARVSGNLTNRRHEATFDPEDPAALPLALFLLNHGFTLRRAAFRTERSL